jgi:pentose-5-phosphate-3-epimerase
MLPRMAARVAEAGINLGGDVVIEVDGGVSMSNIEELNGAGASDFVVGRALIDAEVLPTALTALRVRASRDRH